MLNTYNSSHVIFSQPYLSFWIIVFLIIQHPQSLYDDGAETTRKQLLSSCLSLQIASDDTLDHLLEVWRKVVRRVYHYYQMSAKAYFTYLKLNAQVRHSTYEEISFGDSFKNMLE